MKVGTIFMVTCYAKIAVMPLFWATLQVADTYLFIVFLQHLNAIDFG